MVMLIINGSYCKPRAEVEPVMGYPLLALVMAPRKIHMSDESKKSGRAPMKMRGSEIKQVQSSSNQAS
jgi:hypothetical protein